MAVTVNDPARPTVKVVLAALVIAGGWVGEVTVSVAVPWVIPEVAVMVVVPPRRSSRLPGRSDQ